MMSLFKTADASSVNKKTETEHRIGVTYASGTIRPNMVLAETINRNGGQIKIHLLEQDFDKDFRKGDLFLEAVSENGLTSKTYKNKGTNFQSRAALELFHQSLNGHFKSLNCKVSKDPVTIDGLSLYPIITASAVVKQ